MRKIPKAGPRRYKHAYNVGYRAGIKKATNGSGAVLSIEGRYPGDTGDVRKPIDKLIKLLSLLKEAS